MNFSTSIHHFYLNLGKFYGKEERNERVNSLLYHISKKIGNLGKIRKKSGI